MSQVDPLSRGDEPTGEPTATRDVVEAVRTLINLMGHGGIRELDLSFGDVSIRLRGQGVGSTAVPAGGVLAPGPSPMPTAGQSAETFITAPMIGTFYSSPTPGEPPFVRLGDRIEAGQTVGIIEAMKIMNEIVADRGGVVADILVSNAEAVEYGTPLFRLSSEEASIS